MDTGEGFPLDGEMLEHLSFVRIRDEIGKSGVGPSYRARHAGLDNDVVVKVFEPKMAEELPDVAAAWAARARGFTSIQHPHFVRVHDVVRRRNLHAVVTEYVEQELELPTGERADAVRIAADAARGLAAAHATGVACWRGAPRVRLDPAGRAKVEISLGEMVSELATGAIVYTPPEQCMGGGADPTGDVWMLGTLLFAMLTGGPPFRGDSMAERVRAIASEPLPDLGPDVPANVIEAIARATRKDPAARCSASEFAAAL